MGLGELGRLAAVAAGQAGCVTPEQAAALGVRRHVLASARRAGLLDKLHPAVLRFTDTPLDDIARIRAAVLQAGPGAVASHESALRVNAVTHVPFTTVVSAPPGANHRIDGVRVHRMDDLLPCHLTTVDGLATTTVARAVVDVSSTYSIVTMRHLIDQVTIIQRLTSPGAIGRAYRQVNRRGRFGIRNVGVVLDERAPGQGPAPRSLLERHVDELFAGTPLPAPCHEVPLPSFDGRPGLVDRAWSEARLILEIDGRPWHAREQSMAQDRARDRAAAKVGWVTVRVLDEEVTACSAAVLDDIIAIYTDRLALLTAGSA